MNVEANTVHLQFEKKYLPSTGINPVPVELIGEKFPRYFVICKDGTKSSTSYFESDSSAEAVFNIVYKDKIEYVLKYELIDGDDTLCRISSIAHYE